MKLPTLTQLAREQAKFVKYQDGKLWYQILTTVGEDLVSDDGTVYRTPFLFDFPIPVDAPHQLSETVKDAIQAIRIGQLVPRDVADALEDALIECESKGTGGGEFLAFDKGLRFLRWITPHLKMLQEEQIKNQNVRHG